MAFNEDAVAAENAVEQKLAEAGANEVRRHTFSDAPEVVAPEPVEEQPRDDQGRFASKQEEEAAAAAEETPPEDETAAEVVAEETPGEDPAVAAYLAKYGGDVNKAIQAAVSAQRKLGEQGTELGERRQQAAEYEQVIAELNAIKAQLAQPQPQPMPDQATVDWVDEQIAINPAVAPQYAVQALQAGQTLLYDRIMRQWYDHDAYAATNFQNAVRMEQMKEELKASQPVGPTDEGVQMQAALTTVLTSNPEFNQYADDLGAVIERYPAAAAGLRGSQQEKQQAIETLFALAERDTLRAIALSGQTPTEPASSQEVATSTTSQEHQLEEPAAPSKLDAFREEFRKTAEEMRGGAFVAR